MRSGELAGIAGVNVETLRFYERRGILPEPPRRASGYREYPPEAVDRLRFVRRAQELGFSLDEIKGLLEIGTSDEGGCADVKDHAERKIAEVEQKIADLQAVRRALRRLADRCPGEGPAGACPILGLVQLEPEHEQTERTPT